MNYLQLLESGATPEELASYLGASELAAVTIRIPKNLENAVNDVAEESGMSFSGFIRSCLIDNLANAKSGQQSLPIN